MQEKINIYLESFLVAFSFTLGLGISVYLINLTLSPSRALLISIILATVFFSIFGLSLGYLKRISKE